MQMGSVAAATGWWKDHRGLQRRIFACFSWQIPAIEDYPYAGIDFSRDLAIPVLPGEERGEMGKSPPI
jgi:hypothetical protein